MMRWLSFFGSAAVIAALWVVLPGPEPGPRQSKSPERMRVEAVRRELAPVAVEYGELVTSRRVAAALVATDAPVSLIVEDGAGADSATVATIGLGLEASAPSRAPRRPAQVALFKPAQGEGAEWMGRPDGGVYVVLTSIQLSASDESPHCVRVLGIGAGLAVVNRALQAGANPLAACAFFARFGAPGPGVREWLASGGLHLAMAGIVGSEVELDPVSGIFLPPVPVRRSEIVDLEACAVRSLELCERVFVHPSEVWVRGSAVGGPQHGGGRAFVQESGDHGFAGDFDGRMLSDLLAHFGAEAFEAFWVSGENEVAEAFASAFATSPGEWVRSWALERVEVRSAPPIRRAEAPMALLLVAISGLVAVAVARRGSARV